MKNTKHKIGFIGFGNMAQAITNGLLRSKLLSPKNIFFVCKTEENKKAVQKKWKIQAASSLKELAEASDILILATKPQQATEYLEELSQHVKHHLLISVMAGVTTETLQNKLNWKGSIVRAMPNTPGLIGQGATGIFFNKACQKSEKDHVRLLFSELGLVGEIKTEELMDVITALSGSGPAFVYEFARTLMQTAEELGLDAKLAKDFTLQTLHGATEMLKHSEHSPEELRDQVTSKGGTTEAGLNLLHKKQFAETLSACIKAAAERAQELRN
ncbi:MAG: pyrroline-5-carboxylate reductase [Deltaproteobacteria bacterium]|nr:pyrroline-5-carboxylate reductase [Deltaproteobacteria bacterium]